MSSLCAIIIIHIIEKNKYLSLPHRIVCIMFVYYPFARLDTWESEQETWQETAKVVAHHRTNIDLLCDALSDDSVDNMSPSKRRRPPKRKAGSRGDCVIPASSRISFFYFLEFLTFSKKIFFSFSLRSGVEGSTKFVSEL